jgi:hypothetical protein
MSQEGIERAFNMASWIVRGGIGAPRGTVTSGMRRPPGPSRFRPEPAEVQERVATNPLQVGDSPDLDLDALSARAHEIHSVLGPRAQNHRTTAVLSTDRHTIVAGGRKDLMEAQRAMLRDGEFGVYMPGAHAEVTALKRALDLGFRPRSLATTRPMCKECREFVGSLGGRLLSPTTAIFPGQ